ncbi:protein kinase C and casein kinase II substrate protein 3 isoform X1 [Aedes albopictus]|uniref:Adaptor protein pacsin n=1 Tax=Aedes albopictus TaxID=7160 RepID=A0ABM2A5L4_AEDAL|nr:protein kinase C and casein kinase II substrate protein 3-like isoform X1 [Aedes albopictus]XP_029726853.1 protein kinase C and casein kinase II substrate protein 3-like isoform X1 [Aedes albopictus]XP_029726854.1 protein kinase C and casein kinase II substrate protein 3-like isoform X1 [Aedes albopictus]XP_029726855.1 protein kinase C and casein kinase II substrate protein 3-like isoform X1 [Aedes albopictus]XP_029726856.1 protein kinase C and casein kinase II substrate protein 3-like isofo
MSHHSDDQLLQAGSDSFWEPGNYKRTTKRIEDGYRLCTDLQTLIQERAEIEKGYAKNLKAWSKKWGELIEKGPEYGTTEAAWKGILTEADRLSDLHLKVKDNLCTDVMHQIKVWQKDNYHKTMMHIKERKEMEDQFKKAQKPWAKHLTKVEKCKADYHAACKTERSAANQERNASSDSSLSNDQLKKMQDRTARTKDEVSKCRERYEQALQEINKYNPVYIEDMTSVFIKCQEMEETRLRFFKNVLFSIHKCLNISEDPSLPQIYKEFHHTVNNADHLKDLKWWSNNHGVNMGMSWPTFVEYTEEFRDIAKGIKSKEALPAAPITLIHQRPVAEDLHEYPPPASNNTKNSINRTSASLSISNSNSNANNGNAQRATTPSQESPKSESASMKNSSDTATTPPRTSPARTVGGGTAVVTNGTNGKANDSQNPFDEEEEWDEGDGADNILVDNGEPGVPVKALYDYEGAESDELTFKMGDVFEKLEDEDEQGWCKGRKDGRVGLYPANYVEAIAT